MKNVLYLVLLVMQSVGIAQELSSKVDVSSETIQISEIAVTIRVPKIIQSINGVFDVSVDFELFADSSKILGWVPRLAFYDDFVRNHIEFFDENGKEVASVTGTALDDPVTKYWRLEESIINGKKQYTLNKTLKIRLSDCYRNLNPGKYYIAIMYDYRLVLSDQQNPFRDNYSCYINDMFKYVRSPLFHKTFGVSIENTGQPETTERQKSLRNPPVPPDPAPSPKAP